MSRRIATKRIEMIVKRAHEKANAPEPFPDFIVVQNGVWHDGLDGPVVDSDTAPPEWNGLVIVSDG